MSTSHALEILNSEGINVHGLAAVAGLPEDIIAEFARKKIELRSGQTVALFGNGGRTLWNRLKKPVQESDHPFDGTARESVIRFLNQVFPDVHYEWLFPHPKLAVPLQKIARYMNLTHPSPLGLDLHRKFGPWFAFRSAVLIDTDTISAAASNIEGFTPSQPWASPCETCADRPCLSACPVQAVRLTQADFQLKTCATHRLSPNSECLSKCLSRLACPVGQEHRYPPEQMEYHMLRPGHLKALKSLI